MSKAAKPHIENAAGIIEKFGGIRPMSSKVNVAVTTIQGWKKRNVIPAARKAMILEAATSNKIDLSEFFPDVPAAVNDEEIAVNDDNKTDAVEDVVTTPEEIVIPDSLEEEAVADSDVESEEVVEIPQNLVSEGKPVIENPKPRDEFSAKPRKQANNKDFTEIAVDTERRAITKSAMIAILIVALVLAAVIGMLWPDFKEFGQRGSRLSVLEGDVSSIKDRQSAFKGFVPENWTRQLDDLKKQVEQAKNSIGDSVNTIQKASKEFIAEKDLQERVVQLQSYVSEIADGSGIYALLSRYEGFEGSDTGRNVLDNSMAELSGILAGMKGEDDSYVNAALAVARYESDSLQKTLGDVPQNDLKAAAMLLALTQVRSALNREDGAFDGDLSLLINMVGPENPELLDSLTKLAPHSKAGILSADGLQSEFRTIAGDVVAASLRGEDVSFSEKAAARMNEILQVEKDGELITGTKTQATVNKAETMVNSGNIDAAMGYLKKNLNAKELAPLRPWFRKAEAAMTSRKAKKAIQQAIDMSMGSGFLGGAQLLNDGNAQ